MNADTITIKRIEAIFHAHAAAADLARWIMRQSQDGMMSTEWAALCIEEMEAKLKSDLAL